MTKKTAHSIDDAIIFIWTYIVIVLPPLAILYVMKQSSLETDFFSSSTFTTLDFSTLVGLSIILPAIGSALSVWRKKIPLLFFWHQNKQERLHTATVSLLLSIVLWKFYSIFSSLSFFGLIILFLFFLLYIPPSTSFLSSVDFNMLKLFIFPRGNASKIRVVERICYVMVVLLLMHVFITFTDSQIRAYNHHQSFLARHPKIEKITPEIVYYDTNVILTGKGFGWKGKIDTKFKYQEGKIDISLWTDTKVIFTVPLHWKVGDMTIWIQKPTNWDGKNIMVNSNEIKLRLISRDDGWDTDDDAYFEQLKHLDKETLKINGYK